MDLLRRLRLLVRAHPYWADALLAAMLYLVTVLWPTGGRPSTQWSNFDPDEVLLVAGLLVYAPLALRRRYPVLVLACTVAATVGYMFVGPVRGPILAGSGLAIYTVSSVVERRLALAIGGVAVLSVGIASMALSPEKWDKSVNGIAFAWTAMTVAVGESVRSRRAFVAAIEERARRAEHTREEEARRRVAEERLRVDIEYRFNFGGTEFSELEGIANRTDYDLSVHSEHSGKDLKYFDQESGERYFPYVIEPAAGLNRAMLAFLLDAYFEDEAPNAKGVMEKRVGMRLDPRLAPVKVAVLPLSRNADLSPKARGLAADLRTAWNVEFDDAGAIGKRYRRQDEIGTPFCVTVDFDTLEDNAVTVRERDTMAQERVSLDQVKSYLAARLIGC